MHDALQEVQSGQLREGVPDISWTTEYATLVAPFSNVYAEIGTTWASTIVTFPTVAAHIMGQLMKFMGPDRIVFGSDSVWYGSPQWQIEALWRFQIPEEMRERYGYPEITEADKRKILGLNSARLYGIEGVESGNLEERFKPVPGRLRATHVPPNSRRSWSFRATWRTTWPDSSQAMRIWRCRRTTNVTDGSAWPDRRSGPFSVRRHTARRYSRISSSSASE